MVSGFEPLDILQTVHMLVGQLEKGESRVEIAYRRGVSAEGNRRALEIMYQVFEPCAARWRGVGAVAGSGLGLRHAYRRFDAEAAFEFDPGPTVEPQGLHLRRGPEGSQDAAGLQAVPHRLHTGQSGGPVHGVFRGKLRRVLPLRGGR